MAPLRCVPSWPTRLRALACAGAVLLAASAVHAGVLLRDNWEDGDTAGWVTKSGTWTIVVDGTQALQQTGTKPLATLAAGDPSWTAYTVESRVKISALRGKSHAVAVMGRCQANGDGYYLALTKDTVSMGRRVGKVYMPLAARTYPVKMDTWYGLRMELRGVTLKGFVNGAQELNAADSAFTAGGVALVSDEATATFDEFAALTLGPPPDVPWHQSKGFGTQTAAGLEGQVIKVTTLAGSGPGSLRAAIDATGPRLIVFEIGGVIDLDMKHLTVRNPFCTIAGQTAPAPGITLVKGSLRIYTNDVVVQHIAVRPGDTGKKGIPDWEPDAISVYRDAGSGPVKNVVIDHCSATWAVDGNLDISGPKDVGVGSDPDATTHDVTVYKTIVAQALSASSHSKGDHSKGTLIHDGIYNVSILGSLYAHNSDRNPRFKGGTRAAFVNNVLYNYGIAATRGGAGGNAAMLTPCEVAYEGNVVLKGPNAEPGKPVFMSNDEGGCSVHLGNPDLNRFRDRATGAAVPAVGENIRPTDKRPLWPGDLIVKTALESARDVLRRAGARAGQRDPVDRAIVQQVLTGTGGLIDSQADAGGYPTHKPVVRPLTVPDGFAARRRWLDDLAAEIDTDEAIDTSAVEPLLQ